MDANVIPLTPNNAAAERAAIDPSSGALARLAAMPSRARLMLGLGTAALVALLVSLWLWSQQGNYAPLYPGLSEKDAGAVAAQLTQLNVPYRLADNGALVMVPADKVPELRLKLAQAGLPKGTATGFELLDNARFGQSQLQERTNLQRALEGELVRSITSLAAVQSARVHLALPTQNGFFREQQKPSASVLVTLHAGRTLDRAQVAGIVHLVSSSVPELALNAVSVVDQNANLLSAPADGDSRQGLDNQQLQYVQQIEAGYLKRVTDILEPVLGRDNLRATVTAEVDFTQIESTSEAYKPNQSGEASVRSLRSTEAGSPGSVQPSGIPGAASNQPPLPATAPLTGASAPLQAAPLGGSAGSARRDSTVNYEVDKTVSMKRNAVGSVKRLNAAVLVNHRVTTDAKGRTTNTPLPSEELDKLTALVQESIGFNKERGDSIKVVNIPFRTEPKAQPDEPPLWKQDWLLDLVRAGAVPTAGVLVALLLVLAVVRPALRQIAPSAPQRPSAGLDAVVDDTDKLPGAQTSAPLALEAPKSGEQLEQARAMARQNPAAVAGIVRGWVSGEAS